MNNEIKPACHLEYRVLIGRQLWSRKRINGMMAQFVSPLSANYRQGKVAVYLLDKPTYCMPMCTRFFGCFSLLMILRDELQLEKIGPTF